MPNHFHWVIFVHTESLHKQCGAATGNTRTINQSIGVLLASYTRAIHKQEGIDGSLFQKRTKAKTLTDEIEISQAYWNTAFGTQINISEGKSYLETCIEYIHKNPIVLGLVKDAEDWEFSSYRDYAGIRNGKLLDYQLIQKEGLLPKKSRHPNLSRETTNEVIIGIGSNIDAETNISRVLEILNQEFEVVKISSFIKTKPIGIINQPDFTNGAVRIKTNSDQKHLTNQLKEIEDQMGRDRTGPNFGPRCIDLDIVVWNNEIVDDDYYTRDFLQKGVKEVSG